MDSEIIYVSKEYGLAPCHNGTDPSLPNDTLIDSCQKYEFPAWVGGYVIFLWCAFGVEIVIASFWLRYFWVSEGSRKSIFRFRRNVNPSRSAFESIRERLFCCCRETDEIDGDRRDSTNATKARNALSNALKPPGMPRQSKGNIQYSFYYDFLRQPITDEEVKFGHKIFRLPTFGTEALRKVDGKMSAKFRIVFSYFLIYVSIFSLVADLFLDVKFLNDLSTETLMDVQYIHFNEQALMAMAFYEIPALLCIPLTAYICYKMAWSRNMQYNLMGEVLMISVSYLMEDGPELLLQYFYVDKYSGTFYDASIYPDGFETSGRLTVIASSLASLLIAIGGMANLIALFVEVQFYLDVRAVRNYIDDPNLKDGWNKSSVKSLVSIVWELKKIAEEEFVMEKVGSDIEKIEHKCRLLYEKHARRSSTRHGRPSTKSFRASLRRRETKMANRMTHQMLIAKIRESSSTRKHYRYILGVFMALGLIPFMVNLCRVIAAGYQMFQYRKYHPNCLVYSIDSATNVATVTHPDFFNFACWRGVDYPLVFGNFIGLFLHLVLVVVILISFFCQNELTDLIDHEKNESSASEQSSESDSDTDSTDESVEVNAQQVVASVPMYKESPSDQKIKSDLEVKEAKEVTVSHIHFSPDNEPISSPDITPDSEKPLV